MESDYLPYFRAENDIIVKKEGLGYESASMASSGKQKAIRGNLNYDTSNNFEFRLSSNKTIE